MRVVSNTSPLLNLAIIGELERVREQFEHVLIPQAVLEEFKLETDLPGTALLKKALAEGWLRVKDVANRPFVEVLRREVDAGEAEAIVLAVEQRASWVLLDEQEARRIARTLGLPMTGALGILLTAYRTGQLPSLRTAIRQLREEAGFWIAPALEADLLAQMGEV
ncbi:MAG TPA: DUF3368 domain-containing protein [Rhodothermales bacterium]|nr:DUF3368 domain-containing protein [Rhodothermales bacterium]